MAEAQQRWLQQMRSAIRKMTEASAAVAALHLPNPSLHTHLPLLRTSHMTLLRMSHKLPTPGPLTEFPSTRPEQALFMTDITALLMALVPQLARFGSRLDCPKQPATASNGVDTTEEDIFWASWRLLVSASSALCAVNNTLLDLLPIWDASTSTAPFHPCTPRCIERWRSF